MEDDDAMGKMANGRDWKPTPRQQRFIDCFEGNGAEAARKAGFKHPKHAATRLLSNVHLRERVQAREAKANGKSIATREERQQFWTKMMAKAARDGDKLKASELLGRSQADFLDRTEHSGHIMQLPVEMHNLSPMERTTFARLLRKSRGG